MLKPYQQIAVEHLLNHEQAALFMGIGLGKTLTTLTAFDGLRTLGHARTMLVVAPLRVCNLTWPNEVRRWSQFHHLSVANLRTREGWKAWREDTADIYLCNYEMLPKLTERIREKAPDVITFDELTRAKNHTSKRINALRRVLPAHVHRWGLTGTPTPNSLLELFAQIRLLDGGERLGKSFDLYRSTYFYPVDYMEYDWRPKPGAEERIYARIADIALTLRSSDYLNIPDCVVEDIEVPLPAELMKQYRTLEKDLLLAIGDGDDVIMAPNAAVLANKLLQFTGGSIYREDRSVVPIHDLKTKALKNFLGKQQEPVLIVYNYQHELARLRHALPHTAVFADAKNPAQQQQMEQLWNERRITSMLVHPQSMGHGLNLQAGGSTVVWYSPVWSNELYDQLNGRVIRAGQTRVQRIVRLLCPDTIDDAVVETLSQRDLGQKALLAALVNLRNMRR